MPDITKGDEKEKVENGFTNRCSFDVSRGFERKKIELA
jgi:hypothetical protein